MQYDPRYETLDHIKQPCTGCGGCRWSSKGECLNDLCISDETRARIAVDRQSKKKKREH